MVTELNLVKIPGSGKMCLCHGMFKLGHTRHFSSFCFIGSGVIRPLLGLLLLEGVTRPAPNLSPTSLPLCLNFLPLV